MPKENNYFPCASEKSTPCLNFKGYPVRLQALTIRIIERPLAYQSDGLSTQ